MFSVVMCNVLCCDVLCSLQDINSLAEAEHRLRERKVGAGGRHSPDCGAAQLTAVIIPYRDRATHLAVWLSHLHPVLARQQRDYQVFLVEQVDDFPFNRGALLNIGVIEAAKLAQFSCFVLHDVDMVPETDLALYTCPPAGQVLHMAVSVSRSSHLTNTLLPSVWGRGGVTNFRKKFLCLSGRIGPFSFILHLL